MFNRMKVGLWAGMAAAVALTAGAMITSGTASADALVGEPAPDFTVVDSKGVEHKLSDFAGKRVVLEWTNDGCPFVVKHYSEPHKNMQGLQKTETADEDGVIWLSVISSAPGKQGYADGTRADELTATRDAAPTAVILDPEGTLGKSYGAKTTPHMYIIDKDADQTLVYAGAIDSIPSASVDDIPEAKNYVTAALGELDAGQPVSDPTTKAYGCSVKYGS